MLSEIVGHYIPYILCQVHRLNILMQHFCEANLIFAELFNTLEDLYVFFSFSTKRNKYLENILADIEGSLMLRNLLKTRSTARAESIKVVWISIEGILKILTDIYLNKNIDRTQKFRL